MLTCFHRFKMVNFETSSRYRATSAFTGCCVCVDRQFNTLLLARFGSPPAPQCSLLQQLRAVRANQSSCGPEKTSNELRDALNLCWAERNYRVVIYIIYN